MTPASRFTQGGTDENHTIPEGYKRRSNVCFFNAMDGALYLYPFLLRVPESSHEDTIGRKRPSHRSPLYYAHMFSVRTAASSSGVKSF